MSAVTFDRDAAIVLMIEVYAAGRYPVKEVSGQFGHDYDLYLQALVATRTGIRQPFERSSQDALDGPQVHGTASAVLRRAGLPARTALAVGNARTVRVSAVWAAR